MTSAGSVSALLVLSASWSALNSVYLQGTEVIEVQGAVRATGLRLKREGQARNAALRVGSLHMSLHRTVQGWGAVRSGKDLAQNSQ